MTTFIYSITCCAFLWHIYLFSETVVYFRFWQFQSSINSHTRVKVTILCQNVPLVKEKVTDTNSI